MAAAALNLPSLSSSPSPSLSHPTHFLPTPLSLSSKSLPKSHSFHSHSLPKPLLVAAVAAAKSPISHFFSDDDSDDKPREECGVVGIYGDHEASRLCYLALHALQHRGQEGAGIVSVNDDVLQSVTGVGLVSEVFNQTKLDQLPGDSAIGHVRYSTAGASMLKNVQPFVAGYRFGSVGVAHNGNYPVEPREIKVKRVGDFVDDGLNGSLESIDGGWVQANRHQNLENHLKVEKVGGV